jgi:hypothetical protein
MLTHQLPTTRSLQHAVHPKEWEARVQLAACYRVFAFLGWTEMIYNHITLRLPQEVSGAEKHFLINPFGLHYSEVTASNLVKIDLQGKVMDGSGALCDAHAHHSGRVGGLLKGWVAADQFLYSPVARHDCVP